MSTQLYSTHEAGERLGVTRSTVWRYVKSGRLTAIDLTEDGDTRPRLRIRADELQRFIDEQALALSA